MTINQPFRRLIVFAAFAGLYSCTSHSESPQSSTVKTEAAGTTATTTPTPKAAKAPEQPGRYYGIDISHYQGNEAVELGPEDSLTFVICKATQGLDQIDKDFETNIGTVKTKGYIYGAYHFYETDKDPAMQATHFWNTLVSKQGIPEIAPIVDIENGSIPKGSKADAARLQADLKIFLNTLNTLSGRQPLIYTAHAFADSYLLDKSFANYDLWLAEYTQQPKPKIPRTWEAKGYKIWQKSQSHTLHSEPNDFDVYYGTHADLKK
jgi:lysozyme